MEIIINGRKITHIKKTSLSYSEVCRYADFKIKMKPTITYSDYLGFKKGTLIHLQKKVYISDGMIFNVTETANA